MWLKKYNRYVPRKQLLSITQISLISFVFLKHFPVTISLVGTTIFHAHVHTHTYTHRSTTDDKRFCLNDWQFCEGSQRFKNSHSKIKPGFSRFYYDALCRTKGRLEKIKYGLCWRWRRGKICRAQMAIKGQGHNTCMVSHALKTLVAPALPPHNSGHNSVKSLRYFESNRLPSRLIFQTANKIKLNKIKCALRKWVLCVQPSSCNHTSWFRDCRCGGWHNQVSRHRCKGEKNLPFRKVLHFCTFLVHLTHVGTSQDAPYLDSGFEKSSMPNQFQASDVCHSALTILSIPAPSPQQISVP